MTTPTAFNIEGAIRLNVTQAKAALREMQTGVANTTGAISQAAGEASRANTAAYRAVTEAIRPANTSALELAATTKGSGLAAVAASSGFRSFGMQLNQVAQVGGMTGNWMQALAVQLPDMLIGFGSLGIVLGVASGVMMPFIAGLAEGTDRAGALADASDRLAGATDALMSAQRAGRQSVEDLREKYGEATAEVLALIEAQERLARMDALSALKSSISEIQQLGNGRWFDIGISNAASGLLALQDTFRITRNDAQVLAAALADVGAAKGFDAQADALAHVSTLMETLLRTSDEVTEEQMEIYRATLKARDSAQQLAGVDIASGIASAASEAWSLAEAIQLANLESAALAAGRVGAGAGRGSDPRQFENDPYWNERYFPDPLEYPKPKKERKRAAGNGQEAREAERQAEAVDRLITSLQIERDLLGELDPVQQRMIQYRETLAYATQEQRAEIEKLTAANIEEARTQNASATATKFARDTMYDGLSDLILRGESASEVMRNLAASVAEALLQASLLGDGPLAGVFGWEDTGGLIGAVFSGMQGFSTGGPTGGNNPSKVAGLVHEGEYVFDAASTAQIGIANLDALRAGRLPGYRNGGAVASMGTMPLTIPSYHASGAPPAINISVTVNGARGNGEIEEMVMQGVSSAIRQSRADLESYDRSALPVRVGQITADPRALG